MADDQNSAAVAVKKVKVTRARPVSVANPQALHNSPVSQQQPNQPQRSPSGTVSRGGGNAGGAAAAAFAAQQQRQALIRQQQLYAQQRAQQLQQQQQQQMYLLQQQQQQQYLMQQQQQQQQQQYLMQQQQQQQQQYLMQQAMQKKKDEEQTRVSNNSSQPIPPKKPVNIVELQWPTEGTPFGKPDEPSNIMFEQTETGPRIKAATVVKLIEHATSAKQIDPNLLKSFLITYHSFVGPKEFLELLKQRFCQPLPHGDADSVEAFANKYQKPIQIRVVQLLKSWLTSHFSDFENDETLLADLLDLINNTLTPVLPSAAKLEELIRKRKENKGKDVNDDPQFALPRPKPIIPPKANPTFLDFHPKELARQLTLIEASIYRSILPQECLGLQWSKKDAKSKAPNVLSFINRFNITSNWVVSEILKQETQKLRVEVMNHFIEVAEQCRVLNNFNGCMEILSGLGDSAVHRLKNHWNELKQKTVSIYNELKAILNSDKAFASFRAVLKQAEQPCIPYLGMYLTDLTFIEDGNPDKIGELPNFNKRRLIAGIISEIQLYQQTPYQLDEAPSIKKYLLSMEVLDKETAYQRSLLILPRGGGSAPSNVVLAPIKGVVADDEDFGEMEDIPDYPFVEKDSNSNIRLQSVPESPIICATIPKIIERLSTQKIPQDTQLLESFLLTYRTYISSTDLLGLLIHRYNMPKPRNPAMLEKFIKTKLVAVQARVSNILKTWCEKYTFDFMANRELYTMFSNFMNNVSSKDMLNRIYQNLQQNLKAIKSGNIARASPKSVAPPSYPLRRGCNVNSPKFVDFHHEEIARALCLYDMDLYYRIFPNEFISRAYETSKIQSPFLYQFMKRLKTIQNWVIYEIALFPHETIEQRKEILSHIISIAKSCESLHNYHTAYAILMGLQSNEVKALLQTWDSLPKKITEKFQKLSQTFSSLKSLAEFKPIKDKLYVSEAGCIPPLPLYLTHLRTMDEKDKDLIDNMVNIKKKLLQFEIVNELHRFKTNPYNFEVHNWAQNYVKYSIEKHAEDDPYEEDKNPLLYDIDFEKIKSIVKNLLMEPNVKLEFAAGVKNSLKEFLDASNELSEFQVHVDNLKKEIRKELDLPSAKKKNEDELLENILGQQFPEGSITEWSFNDETGYVYGWPEAIVVPVLENDDQIYLIYSSSTLEKKTLASFLRIKTLYDHVNSSTSSGLAVVGFVSPPVRDLAQQFGVEILASR